MEDVITANVCKVALWAMRLGISPRGMVLQAELPYVMSLTRESNTVYESFEFHQ